MRTETPTSQSREPSKGRDAGLRQFSRTLQTAALARHAFRAVLIAACWTYLTVTVQAHYLVGDDVQLHESYLGCESSDIADSAMRVTAFGDEEDWRLFYAQNAASCHRMSAGATGQVVETSFIHDLSCVLIKDEASCLWFPDKILEQV